MDFIAMELHLKLMKTYAICIIAGLKLKIRHCILTQGRQLYTSNVLNSSAFNITIITTCLPYKNKKN